MKKNKKENYVNNKSLLEAIIKYRNTGELTEELHMMFWEMANNIITKNRFNKYTKEWREDMVSEAYLKCIKVVKKFDQERTNPFAYFTSVISNSFKDYAKGENKQFDLKSKLYNMYYEDGDIDE